MKFCITLLYNSGIIVVSMKTRKSSRTPRRWSMKYKRSINCRHPRGFSQRQHCKYGRRGRGWTTSRQRINSDSAKE